LQTYINGEALLKEGKSTIQSVPCNPINQFDCEAIDATVLSIPKLSYPSLDENIPVIEALDGQLITNKIYLPGKSANDCWVSNVQTDVLKMVVVNRYHQAPFAKCFIKNFGFKQGAIASTVAHDSHNIVAVGVDDEALAKAINLVIEAKGGISCVNGKDAELVLPLPVAGLMSANDGYTVSANYTAIDAMAKSLGSTLSAPFMTLSFMALLVIPHLKLSDKGLFDGDTFTFIE
ncbi:MAG: adenine deaminase C-terminal domain-containing protein, partial [Sediminibacterium sp.]|nr:adenine deaminase C-terminal domain-containing protein [Sediminibacterium sp.]